MSEQGVKASNAVSVYLSPRASEVLKKYVEHSGFGSISRTVEEIILDYDKIHSVLLSSIGSSGVKAFFSNPAVIFMTFIMMVSNLNLNDGSPFEEILKREIEQMVRERSGK